MDCKCGRKIEGQEFFTPLGSTMMAFFAVKRDRMSLGIESTPVCSDCYHWNLDHNGGRITAGKHEAGARLWTIEVSPLASITPKVTA